MPQRLEVFRDCGTSHLPCLKEGPVSWASEFEKHSSSITLAPILGHLNARKLIQVSEQNPQQPSWSMSPEPYCSHHAGKIGPRDTAGCWLCGLNQAQDLLELSLNPAPPPPPPRHPHLHASVASSGETGHQHCLDGHRGAEAATAQYSAEHAFTSSPKRGPTIGTCRHTHLLASCSNLWASPPTGQLPCPPSPQALHPSPHSGPSWRLGSLLAAQADPGACGAEGGPGSALLPGWPAPCNHLCARP